MPEEIMPGVFIEVCSTRDASTHEGFVRGVVDFAINYAISNQDDIPPTVYMIREDGTMTMLVSSKLVDPKSKPFMVGLVKKMAKHLRAIGTCTVFESWVTMFENGSQSSQKMDAVVFVSEWQGKKPITKIINKVFDKDGKSFKLVEMDKINTPADEVSGIFCGLLEDN